MAFSQDILTRIIDVQAARKVIVVFVDGPTYAAGEPGELVLMCKTGPSDINGEVQGVAGLWCGDFLSEAGLEPGGPIDPKAEYVFKTAIYPGQASPQIREVWKRSIPEGVVISHASYATVPNDKGEATLLEAWYTEGAGAGEFKSSAFQVKTSLGEFIESTAPTKTAGSGVVIKIRAIVFAMAKNVDLAGNLQRAKDGVGKILTGADVAPAGMLWSVMLDDLESGNLMRWKIRHGDHRPPTDPTEDRPPNAMTQCYPLGPNYVSGGTTWNGYRISGYRLDREGTETVYGIENIDPAWQQPVGNAAGIPFQDPPPLIDDDLE